MELNLGWQPPAKIEIWCPDLAQYDVTDVRNMINMLEFITRYWDEAFNIGSEEEERPNGQKQTKMEKEWNEMYL